MAAKWGGGLTAMGKWSCAGTAAGRKMNRALGKIWASMGVTAARESRSRGRKGKICRGAMDRELLLACSKGAELGRKKLLLGAPSLGELGHGCPAQGRPGRGAKKFWASIAGEMELAPMEEEGQGASAALRATGKKPAESSVASSS